jgi:hypothetical protein
MIRIIGTRICSDNAKSHFSLWLAHWPNPMKNAETCYETIAGSLLPALGAGRFIPGGRGHPGPGGPSIAIEQQAACSHALLLGHHAKHGEFPASLHGMLLLLRFA